MAADRPFRIALLIERMDPARGGRERSTAQIAAQLARRGHKVSILCQQGLPDAAEGATVVALGRRGSGRAGVLSCFVEDVQRHVGGGGYDIVHATLPVPGANVYQPRGGTVPGQRDASRRRRPLWGGLMADLLAPFNAHRNRMAQLENQVLADPGVRCLAVSQLVAAEFDRHFRRTHNVRVVYNGVDVPKVDDAERARWRRARREELGIAPEAVVFLTAAENFALKGVVETVKAFSLLLRHRPRANARLVVAGGGFAEPILERAGVWSVADKVDVIGHTDEIFHWYAAADVIVLLSWYDPCSRVVLEAVRWGIPSITTAWNGASEVLGDGAGIVVASPSQTHPAAAAMEQLMAPAARAACAQACRAIADSLSVDRHVDELLAVYADIVAGR